MLPYFGDHAHTDRSNFRLKDCINKVDKLIDRALEAGMSGVAITDHEVLSAHVEAIQYVKKGKESGKIPQDFTLGLGNEIYLVDRDEISWAKENNEKAKFYHFLMIAKNRNGYEGLKELSSVAWNNGFFFRGMERVPTYYDDLEEMMKKYKGDIVASTACIGSEFAQSVLKYAETGAKNDKMKIAKLMRWYIDLFGKENFFVELQPSDQEEQTTYNEIALKIADAFDVKAIVATDAHYLSKEQAVIHETYLKSDEGEREVASFYGTTYIMDSDELWNFFKNEISYDKFKELLNNTRIMESMIEEFDLYHEVVIPRDKIPEFELSHLFKDYYDKYEYIRKYANSPNIEDRYHLHLVEEGFKSHNQEMNEENIDRINKEYKELWLTSEKLNQPLSSYYILTKDVVDIMWEVSLVGVSRGSAASWYTVYLLGITQLNPIEYNLPHWRHLTHERPELPDIDLDSESAQRENILELVKERYGRENVLSICTLSTEKLRSSILSSCRGMGIDKDEAQNIANLIPVDKTGMWTLKECLDGDKEQGKKPVKELIEEFDKYPGLREMIETIEGIVSGRSVHASGVYIYNDGYTKQNAMMKTTGKKEVTQFDMDDSDYQGGLKLDFLTVNALDRIRSCMDLLIEEGKIEWQGTLRDTYNKYLHPDVIDLESEDMYELLYQGEILDAFQFDSAVGSQAVAKIHPMTFQELSSGNSLMRLSPDHGESPLDKFVRFKSDINQWYEEMEKAGLTYEEMEIVKEHMSKLYGVADTQEVMMMLSMDERIANFGLLESNKLRKGVAKKSREVIQECEELFFGRREQTGASLNLLNYVWDYCFKPMFGYSFSLPHIAGYTMILMQELNLAYKYGTIFWKTACLSVNSGLFGDKEGNTNYGAVAKAIADMPDVVLPPDINLSQLGFTPLEDRGKILYGLKPISGLGKDTVHHIMENRPYDSFESFYQRMVEDGPVTEKKMITLIKSGCFDELTNKGRRDLMIDFVKLTVKKKDKLTMSNLPHVIDKVPEELQKYVDMYHFRASLFGRNKTPMNEKKEKFFFETFSKEINDDKKPIEYFFKDGTLQIDKKSFEREYKKKIEPLKQWVIKPEQAKIFNKKKMREFWVKNCMGTVEEWEMETVAFYSDKHEFDYIPLHEYFDVKDFFDIEPGKIIDWGKWGKRKYPIFEINLIAGTVVDKNKDKAIVYVSTQSGVVPLKLNKGKFYHYDKKVVDIDEKGNKEVLDDSWFKRGTRVVVVGRRRGDEFVPKKYKSTPYQHTIMKINGYNENDVDIQMEKKRA